MGLGFDGVGSIQNAAYAALRSEFSNERSRRARGRGISHYEISVEDHRQARVPENAGAAMDEHDLPAAYFGKSLYQIRPVHQGRAHVAPLATVELVNEESRLFIEEATRITDN